jgi:putative membrane protein
MGNCGYGMMGAWGWISALFSLVFLALLIGGIILLVRHVAKTPSGTSSTAGGAEAILAERYARGEIDHDEYQQRLSNLRGR